MCAYVQMSSTYWTRLITYSGTQELFFTSGLSKEQTLIQDTKKQTELAVKVTIPLRGTSTTPQQSKVVSQPKRGADSHTEGVAKFSNKNSFFFFKNCRINYYRLIAI